MTKKQKIFGFLVVLPLIIFYAYHRMFEMSGNWLEDYQYHFKFSFLVIAILGDIWLVKLTYKDQNLRGRCWFFAGQIILLLALCFYAYMGMAVVNFNP